MPNLIAYIDTEQRCRCTSPADDRWCHLTRPGVNGGHLEDLLGASTYAHIRPYVEQALAGQTISFEHELDDPGLGLRVFSVLCIPDRGTDALVKGFHAVVTDVTALRDAQRREEVLLLALARSAHLAGIGEMATRIAHQINQPLSAIGLYCAAATRIMERDDPAPVKVRELLAGIHREARRAGDFTLRLQRFLRREDDSSDQVDLNDIVRGVCALYEQDIRIDGASVAQCLDSGLGGAIANRDLAEQVVQHLFRNALDAISEGTIRQIELRTYRGAQEVCVAVSDTGPGVDPGMNLRLFEPFVSTKPGRLGISLFISHKIAASLGGHLSFINRPEGGAVFTFCLPAETP